MRRRRIKAPRNFANDQHRRNNDTLIERCSTARIWLRQLARVVRERAPEIHPALARPIEPPADHVLSEPEMRRYLDRLVPQPPVFRIV